METTFSAFSRPQRSTQQDYLFRNVSQCNMLSHVTAGLKSLYDCIQFGVAHPSLGNACTDADGRFVPIRHKVLLANRYRIQSCIETGGQSAVLVEAKDCFHKMMPVMIKVMHTSYLAVGLKEVQTLRKINSADPRGISHTIQLLNSFRLDDHICLVFPLLNPMSLTDVIADKFLHEDEVLQAIRKISLHLLSALAFLRSLNIIHADVKPENILLSKDGDINTVTLIDFGNAIHHIHSEVSLYYTDFELQTQPYRAPEVHLGNPFSVEVDMWSLGCVLLELFTGRLAFTASDRANSIKMMISILGPLPIDMCKRGKFYSEVEAVVTLAQSSHRQESGAMRLMFAFPCIKNYEFASFLSGLLTYHPDKRMTPWEALQHPFMAPLICIPHFFTGVDVDADIGIIRKSDYHFKQNIPPNVQRLYPSTFDLLRAGTSDQLLLSHSNVAFVEPLGMKENSLWHEKEKPSFKMKESDGIYISSSEKQNNFNKSVKHTLPVVQYGKIVQPIQHKHIYQNNFVPAASYFSSNILPKYELTHKFKRNQKNSRSFEILSNDPENVVFHNRHRNSFSPSYEPNSDYTVKQSPANGDMRDVELMNHHFSNGHFTASDNIVSYKGPKLLKHNKNGTYRVPRLSETDDYYKSETSGHAGALRQSHTYKGEDSSFASSIESTDASYYGNSSNTSLFHQISKHSKTYNSPLRNNQDGSLRPGDQIILHNELPQVLPHLDYPSQPVSKKIPQTAKKCSPVRVSRPVDSFLARSVATKCHSPFHVKRYPHNQGNSFQEYKSMYKEPSFQEAVNEQTSVERAVSFSAYRLPNDRRQQTFVAEKPLSKQQNQHDQTLHKRNLSLCSPCKDTDLDSFHHQTTLSAKDKQDNSLEKIGLVENDSHQTHGIVKTVFLRTKTISICSQNMEADQKEVFLTCEDESTKEDVEESTLSTTEEYPSLDHTTILPNITDNNNTEILSLPVIKEHRVVDNGSHISSTDDNRCVNNCSHVSTIDEHMHVDKLIKWEDSKVHSNMGVHDLTNTLSISSLHKEAHKELPVTSHHRKSSKLISADDQIENNVCSEEGSKLIPTDDQIENNVCSEEGSKLIPADDQFENNVCKQEGSKLIPEDDPIENAICSEKGSTDLPVTVINKMKIGQITKEEPVVDLCDIMDKQCHHKYKNFSQTFILTASNVREIEQLYCLRNVPELKINTLERNDHFAKQRDSHLQVTKTPLTHKHKARSTKPLPCTKKRAPVLYTRPFRVFKPKLLHFNKSSSIERKNNKLSGLCRKRKKGIKFRKEFSLASSSFKNSKFLRGAKMCEFEKTENSQKPRTTLEQLSPTDYQKQSELSQTDISADQVTEEITGEAEAAELNDSNLEVSSPLKSRVTERNNMSTSDIGPILNRHLRLCLTGKDFNHNLAGIRYAVIQPDSRGTQHNNRSGKSMDASRLLRARSVKRALLFHTEKSPKFYANKKSAKAGVRRSLWNSKCPAKELKTETDVAHSDKVDINHTLSELKSSGSLRKANHQFLHLLSSSVNEHNSSDPYEFKVTPAKLQHATNHFVKAKKKGETHLRRSKLSVPASRIMDLRKNLDFSSEVGSTITISDLVEKKSRHMFQNVHASTVQDKVTPLNMLASKNPNTNEENLESSLHIVKKAKVTQNDRRSSICDSTVPTTEKKLLSRHKYTSIKTSASKELQSDKISETVSSITMPPSCSPSDKLLSRHKYRRIKTSASREQQLVKIPETINSILMPPRCIPSDKSKLAFSSNLPSTSNSLPTMVQVSSNNSVTKGKGSPLNTSSNHSQSSLDQTASRKRKFVVDVDKLTVSQEPTLFHFTRLDDCESTNLHGSTFDFAHSRTLQSVVTCTIDEGSSNEEEILLLD